MELVLSLHRQVIAKQFSDFPYDSLEPGSGGFGELFVSGVPKCYLKLESNNSTISKMHKHFVVLCPKYIFFFLSLFV